MTVDIADRSLSDGDSQLGVTFTFTEAPVGFAADRHRRRGRHGERPGRDADPLVYTATFTATDGFTGTGSVSVAAGSYTDAAGNPGGGGLGHALPIDTGNPTVTVDIADVAERRRHQLGCDLHLQRGAGASRRAT